MARQFKAPAPVIDAPTTPVIKAPVVFDAPCQQFISIIGLPESLPSLLDDAAKRGWQVITIVADRRGNDHVAYLTRTSD